VRITLTIKRVFDEALMRFAYSNEFFVIRAVDVIPRIRYSELGSIWNRSYNSIYYELLDDDLT